MYLLGGKKRWAHKRVDETRQKTINKTYAEYKQGQKTGREFNNQVFSLYSNEIFQMVKINKPAKLRLMTL